VSRQSPGGRPGLQGDLGALRRYWWLPLSTLAIALIAALAIGALRSTEREARFRENVIVDALPPLFGPPLLPSPFDYARLATSDGVVADVARAAGGTPEGLRPRLRAEARFNRPEVDFTVSGAGALPVARAWQQAFAEAAASGSGDIERELTAPYRRQLEEARGQLAAASAAAAARPGDAATTQELKAAEENYETASKLAQSYEVVARTMTATAVSVVAPHERSAGIGSTAGRLGIALAFGLLAGVAGALALDYGARRRPPARAEEPAPIEALGRRRDASGS